MSESFREARLRKRLMDEQNGRAALAELTDGMSASEVRFACDHAAMNAVR